MVKPFQLFLEGFCLIFGMGLAVAMSMLAFVYVNKLVDKWGDN